MPIEHAADNAGEAFVLYRLLALGAVAYRTYTGAKEVDIQVIDPRVDVQVKTRRIGKAKGWWLSRTHESLERDDLFFALVKFDGLRREALGCYVVPCAVVASAVKLSHAAWLSGKTTKVRHDTARREISDPFPFHVEGFEDGWLERYWEAWQQLWGMPATVAVDRDDFDGPAEMNSRQNPLPVDEMPPSFHVVDSSCDDCVHRYYEENTPPLCDAYPEAPGIPSEIRGGIDRHLSPRGDEALDDETGLPITFDRLEPVI